MTTTTAAGPTTSATTTVRISQATHQKLRKLAEETGSSLTAAMEHAVECYRRKVFFDILDAQYAALQADPEAWQAELQERAELEGTLMDDLEDDEWPTD